MRKRGRKWNRNLRQEKPRQNILKKLRQSKSGDQEIEEEDVTEENDE